MAKRGRPSLKEIDPPGWAAGEFAGIFLEKDSDRGRHDAYYIQVAAIALNLFRGGQDTDRYKWLLRLDTLDGDWKQRMRLRRTHLAELGRCGPAELIRAVADAVCKSKPPAGEARPAIRALRLGRKPPTTWPGLVGAISRAIDDYRDSHEDCDLVSVREALNEVYGVIQAMIDGPPPEPAPPRPATPRETQGTLL